MKNSIKSSDFILEKQSNFRKKFIAAQLALSVGLSPIFSNYAFGATTSTDPSSTDSTKCTNSTVDCTDLYAGTLSAIQKYGYQPDSTGGLTAKWKIQKFDKGTLSASDMVITTGPNDLDSTYSNLVSILVYACPGSGGVSNVMEISTEVSNTTEITSTTEVTNTGSTFNNQSASVTIGYKTPKTPEGQGSASGTYTYEWGQSYSNSTSTGGGTSVSGGTASIYTYRVPFSVPDGYYQYVQINDAVSKYDKDTWTSNITLVGPISNAVYAESFVNTVPPTYENYVIQSGVDANRTANVWMPFKRWDSTKGDQMASPNGAFAFFPNNNDYLTSLYWKGKNNAQWGYSQGTSEYGSAGMIFDLDPSDGTTPNLVGYTNTNPPNYFWAANPGVEYLALIDQGWLTAYDANWNVIWTSAKYWEPPQPSVPSQSYDVTPSQILPNGQAFQATGTYSSTTYGVNADAGVTTPQPMSQQLMADKQCAKTYSSNEAKPAGYEFVKVQNSPGQNARGQVEQIPPARRNQIHNQVQNQIQNNPNILNNAKDGQLNNLQRREDDAGNKPLRDAVAADGVLPGNKLDRPEEIRKFELIKIKGPIVLKPHQYYASDLPGFKITKIVVQSKELTNLVGFEAGTGEVLPLAKSKKIKLRVGHSAKFSVKGK